MWFHAGIITFIKTERVIQILDLWGLTDRELYVFSIKILPNLFCPPACVGQTVGKLLHVVDPSCALSQQRNLEKKKNRRLQLLEVKLPVMFFCNLTGLSVMIQDASWAPRECYNMRCTVKYYDRKAHSDIFNRNSRRRSFELESKV